MDRRRARSLAAIALVALVSPALAEPDERHPVPVDPALGIKSGLIPPILVVPELVLHAGHGMLGVFGIATSGGLGEGGARYTIGGELGYELGEPGRSSPYFLGSFFHYDASANATGFYERSEMLAFTGGYTWKGERVELQLGGGALLLLHDEVPPCSGFICVRVTFPVVPTFDLSLRYRL